MISKIEDEPIPVSTSEVYHLLYPLKGRYKNIRSASYEIFNKTLGYVEACHKIKDKTAIEDLKFTLSLGGFTPNEVAALGTLFPQNSEAAKIYIPTLNRIDDNIIHQAIEKIQSIV